MAGLIPEPDDKRERMELEKLALEIRNLNRPWWKTPGYVLAAIPILIGAASIAVAWGTGLLDAKAASLDAKRTQLEMDVQAFQQRKDVLSRISATLAERNAGLSRAYDAAKAQLAPLESERNRLKTAVATLNTERLRLVATTATLQTQIRVERSSSEEANRRLRIEPVTTFLSLADQTTLEISPEEGLFIRYLRISDPKTESMWRAEVEGYLQAGSHTRWGKAHLLSVLAIASPDNSWKHQFFDYIAGCFDDRARLNSKLSELDALSDWKYRYTGATWGDDERRTINGLIAKWLNRTDVSRTVQKQLLDVASDNNRQSFGQGLHRTDSALFLRLVRLARQLILPPRATEMVDDGGTTFLARFAPPAYLVTASELFTLNPDSPRYNHTVIQVAEIGLRHLTSVKYDEDEGVQPVGIQFPRSADPQAWRNWRASNAELVRLWSSDGGMSQLERDPALLARSVETFAFR